MVFDRLAAGLGGLVKDVVVGVGDTAEWIIDEVSSIPEAFSVGYSHGLITGSDVETTPDHHTDVAKLESEGITVTKFGTKPIV